MIVHIRLIDITWLRIRHTIATTEDTVQTDGGTCRYIDDGTPRDTSLVTGTIYILHLTTHQVNNSRGCDPISIILCDSRSKSRYCRFSYRRVRCIITHTQTTIVTSAEYFHILEVRITLRNVNQHIAAILHLVTIIVAGMIPCVSLTGAINLFCRITTSIIGFEVHEGILHPWLVEAVLASTIRVGIGTIVFVCIVVVTIASTEDILHTPLNILRIGRSFQYIGNRGAGRIIHLFNNVCANAILEIHFAKDTTA